MPDPTFLHLEAVPTTWPPYDKVAVANFDYTAEQAQVVIAKMVSKDSGLRNGGDENLVKSRRHGDTTIFKTKPNPKVAPFLCVWCLVDMLGVECLQHCCVLH